MCLEKTTTPDGRRAPRYVQDVLRVLECNDDGIPTKVQTRLGIVALNVTHWLPIEHTTHYEGTVLFPKGDNDETSDTTNPQAFSLTMYDTTHNNVVGELRPLFLY